MCIVTTLNQGLRNGGGIGDILRPPSIQEPLFPARVIYDMIFFFVVIIIVLNLIFGVIIDTFADLRSEKQQKEEVIKNSCFICGELAPAPLIRSCWSYCRTSWQAWRGRLLTTRLQPLRSTCGTSTTCGTTFTSSCLSRSRTPPTLPDLRATCIRWSRYSLYNGTYFHIVLSQKTCVFLNPGKVPGLVPPPPGDIAGSGGGGGGAERVEDAAQPAGGNAGKVFEEKNCYLNANCSKKNCKKMIRICRSW